MDKKVYKNNHSGMRNFKDDIRKGDISKGDTVWILLDVEKRVAPYEDSMLASSYTYSGRHPLTGEPMFGITSATALIHMGPVFTEFPSDFFRDIAKPGPQVRGPLPAGEEFDRPLDKAELRALTKMGRENAANQKDQKRSKKGWL